LKVTCILLSYNCQDFVEEAFRSLLTQDFAEPMDVIASDDASSDATFEVMQEVVRSYSGPHIVRLLRQPVNTGTKSAHLNAVCPLAHGDIIVSFDADDVFEPKRVRRIVEEFRRNPDVAAVYSQLVTMDEAGKPLGSGRVPRRPDGMTASRWYAKVDSYASGGTLAFRRDVVTSFPPLNPDIYEDVVLPFRASLLGDVAFIDEPLIRARRHAGSLTAHFSQFESLSSYRERMHRGLEKVRKQLASRLEDIDVARRIAPDRESDWQELEHIARSSMADAEMSLGLFSARPTTRWFTLARLVASGKYRRDLPQNLAIALVPETYLRYKRRRLASRADS